MGGRWGRTGERVATWVVVFALLGTGVGVGLTAAAPAAVSTALAYGPTVGSDPAVYGKLARALVADGHGAEVAALGELPLGVVERFVSVNLNPASTNAEVARADLAAFAASSGLQVAFNWGNLLSASVGGCAAAVASYGVVLGVIGGLTGLGLGCVAGAASGALGNTAAQLWQTTTNGQAFAVSDAEAANLVRTALGEANIIDALLPATNYFFGRLADVAAEQQIGNSTFNAGLDLNQSSILGELGPLAEGLVALVDSDINLWASFASSNGAPLVFCSGGGDYNCNLFGGFDWLGVRNASGANGPLYVPPSGLLEVVGTGSSGFGCSGIPSSLSLSSSPSLSDSETGCFTDHSGHFNYTLYATSASGTGNVVNTFPKAFGSPTFTFTYAAGGVPFCVTATACSYQVVDPLVVTDNVTHQAFPSSSTLPLTNLTNLFNEIGGLEYNAVSTGQIEWSYLRTLGYTNPSAIPPSFQILPPVLVLPPSICTNNVSIYKGTTYHGTCLNLNTTEMLSLFESELISMANFFNSSTYQQSLNACSANCTFWGNLNEYAVGDVYLPNVTAERGGSETFATPASWAYAGHQLLFFPTLHALTIKVNTTFEIPATAPTEVVVLGVKVANGVHNTTATLQLTGNGTSSGAVVNNKVAGDAVYLTNCVVNGTTKTSCFNGVFTVNYTQTQLLCSANSSTCPQPTVGAVAGGCGGTTPFFGTIVNDIAGFVGGNSGGILGSLGCVVAWILGLVVGVAILAVIVYAVVGIARFAVGTARGGKKE